MSCYADPALALDTTNTYWAYGSPIPDNTYIALGGNDPVLPTGASWPAPKFQSPSTFTQGNLTDITASIQAGYFSKYMGIVFVIDNVDEAVTAADFETCFYETRRRGLNVIVCVTHSAPNGMTTATNYPASANLMADFLTSPNINYLVPQLFTTGLSTEPIVLSPSYLPPVYTTTYLWSNWFPATRTTLKKTVNGIKTFESIPIKPLRQNNVQLFL